VAIVKINAGLIAVCVIAVGTSLLANDKAPLGSPDFYPSPEHPVGWRGDGSGRFPGATPPTVWNRRFADPASETMVQAVKPNGKPGTHSQALAYCTVRDWLVAGPFPAADPEKDIDKDFLGGEAAVQPDADAKAGDKQWKVHHASEESQAYHNHTESTCREMWVDFVYALGTLVPREKPTGYDTARYANLDNRAAYAHTYLYAPRQTDADVDIHHELPAVKMWINGVPQRVKGNSGSIKIHLNEGWNRLLIKAICDKAQVPYQCAANFPKDELGHIKWRFAAYLRPAGSSQNYSGGYETKNIAWMLKLTGCNASQPIVVGDKLFVGGDNSDLFCVDKQGGKVLWMHTGTYWDAMTAEQRAAVKDKAEPLLAKLDKSNAELVSLLNANITPQGLDASRQAVINQKLGERYTVLKSLHNALSDGRKGKLHLNANNNLIGAGSATPTSDGKQVYWVVQGEGGYLTSAFDLNGKLIWSNLEFQKIGVGEHGSHSSPLLHQGKLYVCTMGNLIARDAATGKELWRAPGGGTWERCSDYPIVVQFKGRPALQTADSLVSLDDGAVLVKGGYTRWEIYVPVVEDGVLYNSSNRLAYSFEAIEIPKQDGEKHKVIWNLDTKTLYGPSGNIFGGYYVASPLFVDGVIY
jgi:outer membrane protein assembly factor BamB